MWMKRAVMMAGLLVASAAWAGPKAKMSPQEKTTLQFMESDGWTVTEVQEHVYQSGVNGDNGSYRVYVQFLNDVEQVVFYFVINGNVPEAQRLAMAEFLTRANYGMRIGNFEMDFNDGEVRYKTIIDVEGSILKETQVKNYLNIGAMTLDRYYPGIQGVMSGAESALAAVQRIEN